MLWNHRLAPCYDALNKMYTLINDYYSPQTSSVYQTDIWCLYFSAVLANNIYPLQRSADINLLFLKTNDVWGNCCDSALLSQGYERTDLKSYTSFDLWDRVEKLALPSIVLELKCFVFCPHLQIAQLRNKITRIVQEVLKWWISVVAFSSSK